MNLHDRVRIEMSMVNFLELCQHFPNLRQLMTNEPDEINDEPELPDPEPEPPPVRFSLSPEQRERLVKEMS